MIHCWGGSNLITWVSGGRNAFLAVVGRTCDCGKNGQRDATSLALRMEGGTMGQRIQEPVEAGKGKKMDPLLEFSEGTQPC